MRNKKIIMVALIMAVISLTVGFAAFSSSLNISSVATVTPTSSSFGVKFSSSSTELKDGSVNASNSIGSAAIIVNSSTPTISNLKASFTEPGQSVSYTFYAMNIGEYDAYLNRIVFNTTPSVTCTGGTGSTQSLVDAACSSIHISIKVGSENAVENTTTLTNHILTKSQKTEQVVVTLTYDSTGQRVDGPMNVSFSDISLIYSTVAESSGTSEGSGASYAMLSATDSYDDTITDTDDNLVFRSSAELSNFDHVEIDGVTVDEENYTLSSGSTIVKFNSLYALSIPTGKHTVKIVSNDGYASSEFEKIGSVRNKITFYIDYSNYQIAYEASEGMTWCEWIYSYGISTVDNGIVQVELGTLDIYVVDVGNGPYTNGVRGDAYQKCNDIIEPKVYDLGGPSL